MSAQKQYRVAAGIVRKADHVLLVRQQGLADPEPTWALPGGMVEDGELYGEALVREIREETGLEVAEIGRLAYLVQVDNREERYQTLAVVYEVSDWSGRVGGDDPDRLIHSVEFVALEDAIRRIEQLPWRHMREPAVAYLTAPGAAPKMWQYRQHKGGEEYLESSYQ